MPSVNALKPVLSERGAMADCRPFITARIDNKKLDPGFLSMLTSSLKKNKGTVGYAVTFFLY